MEEWALEWLKKQRELGKRCLEIKYIQGKPYVYNSTSVYNKETKKTKKVSYYIGRLTPDRGILTKGSTRQSQELTANSSRAIASHQRFSHRAHDGAAVSARRAHALHKPRPLS